MLHHMLRAVQKKLTALSYIQRLANTSINPTTLSATPQSGDILIYIAYSVDSGLYPPAPSNVIPSGFTQICTHSTGGSTYAGRSTIAYKISNGTESSLSGMENWTIEQFRGNGQISSITITDSGGSWTTSNPPSATLDSPTSLPALAVGIGWSWEGTLAFTFSVTGQSTINLLDNVRYKTRYINYSATGNTLSADVTDQGILQGYSAAVITFT